MARSKYEIMCEKELQSKKWFTDFKIRPSRPNPHYATDYWHLFDLLAWKPGEIRLISVKGKSCPKKHKEDLQRFKVPEGVSVELWRYDRNPKDKRKIRRRITKYE